MYGEDRDSVVAALFAFFWLNVSAIGKIEVTL